MTILAEYECEEKVLTVEILNVDGDSVTIASDKFPRVFVRHQGWSKQPTMTINKKWLQNIHNIDNGIMQQVSAELVTRDIGASHKTISMMADAPEVAPWDEDLGARFIISGGEVLELDSHLESAYDERNGDIETDMTF